MDEAKARKKHVRNIAAAYKEAEIWVKNKTGRHSKPEIPTLDA